jgi:hypothetical protein
MIGGLWEFGMFPFLFTNLLWMNGIPLFEQFNSMNPLVAPQVSQASNKLSGEVKDIKNELFVSKNQSIFNF